MTQPNMTPDGIRYGVIAGNSLHPGVLDEMYCMASAKASERLEAERRKELHRILQVAVFSDADAPDVDYIQDRVDDIVHYTVEWECCGGLLNAEEPSALIVYDGCEIEFGYLGGVPLITIVSGPIGYGDALCSPCVPGAVDLDAGFSTVDNGGHRCFIPPAEWLWNEEDVA